MANASSALQLLAPQIPAAPASPTEVEIGKATAAAVIAIAMGIDDYATAGAMTPSTRIWSGCMLGRLAQLRLDTIGEMPDFGAVALAEGRRALQEHPARIFLVRLGKEQVDMVIDELIAHALTISAKVAADEQAARAN